MAASNNEHAATSKETRPKRFSSLNKMPSLYQELGWGIGTYRWFVFHRKTNGFNQCLIKIGSRWAVDLDRFEEWMESHREVI